MTSSRSLLRAGWALLVPPAIYALASEHGQPFMLGFLYGPESKHTTIGLFLLATALVLCPLAAATVSWRLWGRQRSAAFALLGAALFLFAAGLTLREPYAAAWTLGPGADHQGAPPER